MKKKKIVGNRNKILNVQYRTVQQSWFICICTRYMTYFCKSEINLLKFILRNKFYLHSILYTVVYIVHVIIFMNPGLSTA